MNGYYLVMTRSWAKTTDSNPRRTKGSPLVGAPHGRDHLRPSGYRSALVLLNLVVIAGMARSYRWYAQLCKNVFSPHVSLAGYSSQSYGRTSAPGMANHLLLRCTGSVKVDGSVTASS